MKKESKSWCDGEIMKNMIVVVASRARIFVFIILEVQQNTYT